MHCDEPPELLLPSKQLLHPVAPAALYVLLAHDRHVAWPLLGWYVPAVHCWHVVDDDCASCALAEPGPHGMHDA